MHWPNIPLTTALLCVTIWFAIKRSHSPVDLFLKRADAPVVAAIHRLFSPVRVRV